jgi:hypothetical protein
VYATTRTVGSGGNYGNDVTVTGSGAVLVKYDSSGTAQWARSVSADTGTSSFSSVATDGPGNVYAVGSQSGTGTFDYGNGITATGTYSGGNNAVLVKYSE